MALMTSKQCPEGRAGQADMVAGIGQDQTGVETESDFRGKENATEGFIKKLDCGLSVVACPYTPNVGSQRWRGGDLIDLRGSTTKWPNLTESSRLVRNPT